MRAPVLTALCVSALLLGLAAGIYKVHFPPGPIADEAAYVLMAQSLWHDHDLAFESPDLLRAYRLWDQGPNGLILSTTDGGRTMHYAKPFVYSLAALPFYLVWKAQGFVVFNMALYLAMLWSAVWFFRRRQEGDVHLGLLLGGFFFASAAFVYVFWMQPEVFNMACVFFALLAWQALREREAFGRRHLALLGIAGALLAAAAASKENLEIFAAPIAVDLLWRRKRTGDAPPAAPARERWKAVLAFVLPALFAVLFMAAAEKRLTGSWSPYRGVQRRSFDSEFPIESPKDFWALYRGTSYGSWSGLGVQATPRTFLRDAWYFVAGRHTGLLPYFPFALFLLALYVLGPKDRSRHLLFLALAGYCLSIVLLRPDNYQGGLGFLGNRYFASVYPALLFLPGRLAGRKSLLLPYAAAGVWTAAVVAVPLLQIAPEATLQAHVRTAPFQALPLELTLLHFMPGYFLRGWAAAPWVMAGPKENLFAEEHHPNGLWVRGASRSEVYLAAPAPEKRLHLRAYSISDQNVLTLRSAVDRVSVRFDSVEKREGTPVDLALGPAAARDLGILGPPQTTHEWIYRLTVESTDGVVPARRDPKSQDLRYLGTFLSVNDHAP